MPTDLGPAVGLSWTITSEIEYDVNDFERTRESTRVNQKVYSKEGVISTKEREWILLRGGHRRESIDSAVRDQKMVLQNRTTTLRHMLRNTNPREALSKCDIDLIKSQLKKVARYDDKGERDKPCELSARQRGAQGSVIFDKRALATSSSKARDGQPVLASRNVTVAPPDTSLTAPALFPSVPTSMPTLPNSTPLNPPRQQEKQVTGCEHSIVSSTDAKARTANLIPMRHTPQHVGQQRTIPLPDPGDPSNVPIGSPRLPPLQHTRQKQSFATGSLLNFDDDDL